MTEEGNKIVEYLQQHAFEVSAAFWVKTSSKEVWRLYIVSPIAESIAWSEAYGQFSSLIVEMDLDWVDRFTVKLIGPNHPMAKAVLAIHADHVGKKARPIHWSGPMLGNVSIEGAFLYPLPVLAAMT